MRRCIELARIAKERGDAPVGSVVVVDRVIVGEGIEELPSSSNLTGHAEILACQDAVNRIGHRGLSGATLYTTAEPCFMCSFVIRQCEVALVVYGSESPEVGGVTSQLPVLTAPDVFGPKPAPHVLGGMLFDECRRLRKGQ